MYPFVKASDIVVKSLNRIMLEIVLGTETKKTDCVILQVGSVDLKDVSERRV